MIERYTLPEMGGGWSDENKYKTWLVIEVLACEALAELGEIPAEALAVIKEKAAFTPERILEIEETTQHDVIAFLTNVAENVGPESRYIHVGMTSSDLLDTSLSCQLKEAGGLIVQRCEKLVSTMSQALRGSADELLDSVAVLEKLSAEPSPDAATLRTHTTRFRRVAESLNELLEGLDELTADT